MGVGVTVQTTAANPKMVLPFVTKRGNNSETPQNGVTKRRSSQACIGNPKPEQETIKGVTIDRGAKQT